MFARAVVEAPLAQVIEDKTKAAYLKLTSPDEQLAKRDAVIARNA